MNIMQKYKSKFCTIIVLTFFLFFTGCWEFLSIDQPDLADPNSTFEVPITVALTPEEGSGLGYFGIRLPIGWTVENNISFSGILEGTFVYSSQLSDSMKKWESSADGYYWWIGGSDSIYGLPEGNISFTPQITTDNQKGTFFIDYMLTGGGFGVYDMYSPAIFSRSHPISIDAPMKVTVTNTNDSGEGSLKQAISEVSSSGEILFDLTYPATIVLDSELVIEKNLTITGPGAEKLTISGNNKARVFHIGNHENANISVNISNLTIADGNGSIEDDAGRGGGIICLNSALDIENVKITNNTATDGGGIYCSSSKIKFSYVRINGNTARNLGGGILFSDSSEISFDNQLRCNIYYNNAALGNDLYNDNNSIVNVVLDTFSVLYPTSYYAYPPRDFNFDILNAKIVQYDSDLYVSKVIGNNNNNGTSWSDAFHSISFAFSRIMADSLHPHTIFVGNGIYSPYHTDDSFPLRIPDYVTLSGKSRENVILCAGKQGAVIQTQKKQTYRIENVTITGGNESGVQCRESILELNNVKIENNSGKFFGGIFCDHSLLNITNSIIINNTAESMGGGGGGIRSDGSEVNLSNVLISSNYAINGGGIRFSGNLTMTDVKIIGNTADYVGGGIVFSGRGIINLAGVTIAKNMARKGGGISFGNNAKLYFDPENRCNIYANRASSEADDIRYSASDSTKIAIVVDTFTVLNPTDEVAYPLWKYDFDILNDISGSTDINAQSETLPTKFALNQNYPNPFNPKTVIRYALPVTCHLDLSIYNILGQKVATLVNRKQPAGSYSIEWDASKVSSGVYYYRLEAEGYSAVKKMILLR